MVAWRCPALTAQVVVPDQKLPVLFSVRAHVTTTDLVFAPPALDFGPCVMAEDTGVVLRVTNPSALPQTFGFVGLPPTIRVMPNDGFGHILPGACRCSRIMLRRRPVSSCQPGSFCLHLHPISTSFASVWFAAVQVRRWSAS